MHRISKDVLIAHMHSTAATIAYNYHVLTIVCPLFLRQQNTGLCQLLCLGGNMPNRRTTSQALQPSEFDNKIKLNVIVDRSRTFLHPGEVLGS